MAPLDEMRKSHQGIPDLIHSNRCLLSTCFLLLFVSVLGSATAKSDEFLVSPGDKLQAFIPGSEKPEQIYIVDIKGYIDLGVYGKLKVVDNTLKKAEGLLKQHLSKYLKSVEGISLFLRDRGRIVLITGCVINPGVVSIESTDDLWQALHRAGGLSPCADVTRTTFFRNGVEVNVDLRAYLTGDSKEPLPMLLAGDTIFVPSGPGMTQSTGVVESFLGHEAVRKKVFVIGAVGTPGIYNLAPDLDILTLVAAANGPSPIADLSHTILLTREKSVTVNLQQELIGERLHRKMLPDEGGAIIYIPTLQENIDVRLGEHINFLGSFTRTGRIPVSGPIKLIDAIGLAGGFAENAKTRKLRVIEEGPGYTLVMRYNLKRYLKHGGAMGRILVPPGSTIMLGRVNLEPLNTTLSMLGVVSMVSSTFLLWANYVNNSQ